MSDIRGAGTVILVRDGVAGLEVFLMERSRTVGFMASAWVFPGGRVDAEDAQVPVVGADEARVPRRFWAAAARELGEEAGVWFRCGEGFDVSGFRVWSHWLTPPVEPRRYDTWFFVVGLPVGVEVVIDGREAVAGEWVRPGQAMAEFFEDRRALAPPTFRTLWELERYGSVAEVLGASRRTPLLCPQFLEDESGLWALLPGDAEFTGEVGEDLADPPFRFPVRRFWRKDGAAQ